MRNDLHQNRQERVNPESPQIEREEVALDLRKQQEITPDFLRGEIHQLQFLATLLLQLASNLDRVKSLLLSNPRTLRISPTKLADKIGQLERIREESREGMAEAADIIPILEGIPQKNVLITALILYLKQQERYMQGRLKRELILLSKSTEQIH